MGGEGSGWVVKVVPISSGVDSCVVVCGPLVVDGRNCDL